MLRDLQSSRIFQGGNVFPANTVDCSQDVRLGKLRRRTTKLVPAAGVDNQKRSIRVLKHVGGMKIRIVGEKKILVSGSEGRPGTLKHVPRYFVQVKLAGKEIVLILRAQNTRFVSD